ncbi:MAG: PIN domain protein [uncultured Sulfurovum sp.]|uniref:PIN domain protein n=1 Tax=uncultured Sulfurovum sp. TaxID=269237 RepID=A0A6S6TDT1_9BACT|nr:MAG: PIN domain protein [uncultured Sulfurovum sp.]
MGSILYINSDTVTNAFYIVSRQKKYTKNTLLDLMKKVILLFSVVPVVQSDTLEAIELCMDETNKFRDYEDALQYVCAKNIEAQIILTNDKGFVSLDIETARTL